MTLVGESGKVSDFRKRMFGSQQTDCFFNSQFPDVFTKGEIAKIFGEFTGKIGRVYMKMLRNFLETQAQVDINLILDNFFQFFGPVRNFPCT